MLETYSDLCNWFVLSVYSMTFLYLKLLLANFVTMSCDTNVSFIKYISMVQVLDVL